MILILLATEVGSAESRYIFFQDLTQDELAASIPTLNALASLNHELNNGDEEAIWNALNNPALAIERLNEENKTRTCVSSMNNHNLLALTDISK